MSIQLSLLYLCRLVPWAETLFISRKYLTMEIAGHSVKLLRFISSKSPQHLPVHENGRFYL